VRHVHAAGAEAAMAGAEVLTRGVGVTLGAGAVAHGAEVTAGAAVAA
jgi:hypothetical protein